MPAWLVTSARLTWWLAAQAKDILGTSTKRDTANEALRRVVQDRALDELIADMTEQYADMSGAEIDAERVRAWHGEDADVAAIRAAKDAV